MNPRKKFINKLNHRGVAVAPLSRSLSLLKDAERAFIGGAGALEIRADCFSLTTLKKLPVLMENLRRKTRLPIIFTLRNVKEGGEIALSFQRRMKLFGDALPFVDGIDVEIRPESFARPMVRLAHSKGRFVILSYHDFVKTPPGSVFKRLESYFRALGGDIFKVAARAKSERDVLRLLCFLKTCRIRRTTVIPMGTRWKDARIQAFKEGACLGYGYVGRPTAPGQPSLRDLSKIRPV